MKIGELALLAQCSTDTIRFYEKQGLLPATERTASNYRNYPPELAERLRLIRNCRGLDMTLQETRALLALMDAPPERCGAVNEWLDAHLEHVDLRIQELVQLRQQLTSLRQQCQSEDGLDRCGILRGLATMSSDDGAKKHSHLE